MKFLYKNEHLSGIDLSFTTASLPQTSFDSYSRKYLQKTRCERGNLTTEEVCQNAVARFGFQRPINLIINLMINVSAIKPDLLRCVGGKQRHICQQLCNTFPTDFGF